MLGQLVVAHKALSGGIFSLMHLKCKGKIGDEKVVVCLLSSKAGRSREEAEFPTEAAVLLVSPIDNHRDLIDSF
ncbi:hypothetical protein OPV22_023010 [Ensete ventricosum]|uniref:Uncharacterized protein n=1 Tax=Ensete ventricosum TaxID=4639 RepID=A0AAV8QPQ4_ENSVE|nr:hypothetical protein OPV22_023010 [Ensete ventricosum]